MEHNKEELLEKLRQMHPEIQKYNLNLDAEWLADKNAWLVKVDHGDLKLHTYLDKSDADACLEGTQCVYLGVQIGQFVNNFEILERQGG
jgi:hypothetical protein